MRRLPYAVTAAALALLAPGQGRAGGFYIYEHSAVATGMADARTALWDDPSSLFYNPAAITELDGFQLVLGDTLLLPEITYTPSGVAYNPDGSRVGGAGGDICETAGSCHSATSDSHVFYPAHVYFTAEIVPWLHAGLSWNNPFGLGTYWPKDWDGKFTAYQTYIETHFIEPTLALDIAALLDMPDKYALSFAVGGTYVYGKAKLTQLVDATEVYDLFHEADDPLPIVEMAMEGDGHGGGYQFSFFAADKDWISFGASVRSNVVMDFSGTAHFTAPAAAFPGWGEIMRTLGLLPESTPGSTTIELPWNMNFGVAFLGLPHFTFAADVYVALWESYDQLQVRFDCEGSPAPNNCGGELNANAIYPKKWNTGVQIAFGAEYRPITDLAIRLGYGFVSNPANPVYYDGMLPDGNRHLITVGLGYRAPTLFKVDVGYMLALWGDTKDNDVGSASPSFTNGQANGAYDTLTHVIAISLGFSFDVNGMAPPPTLEPTEI
ncbi:MAG: outer membrane protein transport protein [Deltaproteobacteria bacterium]|nr:outer membrane protein transport protein [Deltaproteobacteria bacterium]